MPSQRGLKLLLSVLGFPAGAGTIAYTLSGNYTSLMNFDGTFFLVKATQELYDDGIPKVPKDVQNAMEWVLGRKDTEYRDSKNGQQAKRKKQRETGPQSQTSQATSSDSTAQEEKPEIFADDSKEKKYWCRYFDYSGGRDNVIMQYDPFCTLYNVFDASLQQASTDTSSQSQHKQITVKLEDFQTKTEDLEKKRLKSNAEFKKGGFYVLKLDKNKIPQANSTFTIEITKPGKDKWRAEKTYQPKISAVRIQAQLTGDPLDSVKFTFSNPLPSSRLLVKKVNGAGTTVDSSEPSTSPSAEDEDASYYFKNSKNGYEKLYVENAWSFGSGTQATGPKATTQAPTTKFDLTTLDKEPLKNFGSNSQQPSQSTPEEKHYLFKNVSDFWKYQVGDTIELYKSTKQKNGEQQNVSENEKKIGTFSVVAGVVTNLSPTLLRCVSSDQFSQNQFKANLRTNPGGLIDKSKDTKGDYCRKDEPVSVLVLIGYNGDV